MKIKMIGENVTYNLKAGAAKSKTKAKLTDTIAALQQPLG